MRARDGRVKTKGLERSEPSGVDARSNAAASFQPRSTALRRPADRNVLCHPTLPAFRGVVLAAARSKTLHDSSPKRRRTEPARASEDCSVLLGKLLNITNIHAQARPPWRGSASMARALRSASGPGGHDLPIRPRERGQWSILDGTRDGLRWA